MNDQIIIDNEELIPEKYLRIITCDPSVYFERSYTLPNFSHFKRTNSLVSEVIFPQEDKSICACGCGGKLSGRRRRWATDECSYFSRNILFILSGAKDFITPLVEILQGGRKCFNCGLDELELYKKNKSLTDLHLDHIIPVHKGGGCSWLGNYQLLCVPCHKIKTKNDLKR